MKKMSESVENNLHVKVYRVYHGIYFL
jgi:hypothetical protein